MSWEVFSATKAQIIAKYPTSAAIMGALEGQKFTVFCGNPAYRGGHLCHTPHGALLRQGKLAGYTPAPDFIRIKRGTAHAFDVWVRV